MNTFINKHELAWCFLQKNSNYKKDYFSNEISITPKINKSNIIIQKQIQSDRGANKWGLYAYINPNTPADKTSPFWSIIPPLNAIAVLNSKSPLFSMMQKAEATVSGLLLLNGDLILKIKRERFVIQIRIAEGHLFDETSGLQLNLHLNDQFPFQLSQSHNLWNIVSGKSIKKAQSLTRLITMNFFSSLMPFSMVNLIAK